MKPVIATSLSRYATEIVKIRIESKLSQTRLGTHLGPTGGDHWGAPDHRLEITAVGTRWGWGRGKYAATQGRRALEQKYSSPLNMSIRINALSDLSFRLIQVLVEVPKTGQRR